MIIGQNHNCLLFAFSSAVDKRFRVKRKGKKIERYLALGT
ncbi:hypothetical protein RIEGSTA812A_PEG_1232 [invertebrate metagenome]|uniref:Uncharacterized protein n=1 Tax=invertebrate metagenome TaxID=1711999 RepID=A0A484H6S0_9ZZZZ